MEYTLPMMWLEVMMLAAVRITAFIVIAPPFSYGSIPMRIRGGIGAAMGLAVVPRALEDYEPLETWDFLSAIIMEVVAGASLGFLIFLVFAAVQAAGSFIDLFGGFSLAIAFDPGGLVQGAQFTRLFHISALALLVASDAYQIVLSGIFRSFDAMPLGAGVNLAAVSANAITGVGDMFVAAVEIAAPLLVVLFMADAGFGLLTRVAPALNVFALGFPVKILLTVSLAGLVYVVLPSAVSSAAQQGIELFRGVFTQ